MRMKETFTDLDPSYERDFILQFYRNGRWGTCSGCPRDSIGHAYPEHCSNTDRYDHQLGMIEFVEHFYIINRTLSNPNFRWREKPFCPACGKPIVDWDYEDVISLYRCSCGTQLHPWKHHIELYRVWEPKVEP